MTQTNRPAPRGRATTPQRYPANRSPQAQRPAGARPARLTSAAAPQRGAFSRFLASDFPLVLAMCVVAIAIGVALQWRMPNGFALKENNGTSEVPVSQAVSEIHSDGPLRLNELMSANAGTLVDADGNTPDWVEVANVSRHAVNLRGYILARNAKAGNVFEFPDMTLEPDECVLVFADGQLNSASGQELHAPFRLSSGGDVLMLFNADKAAVDTVNIPALGANVSYARRSRDVWETETMVTPGRLNTEESYQAMNTVAANSDVVMVEIVASNTKYRRDDSGAYLDYVILQNNAQGDISIGGWFLSDDPQRARAWRFPEGTMVPAGGKLVVFCAGQADSGSTAYPHTSFRLSTEGETLTLSDATGQPVDRVTYDLLHPDTAYLRGGDGTWSVGEPSS